LRQRPWIHRLGRCQSGEGLLAAERQQVPHRDLPEARTTRPAGGYFVWLELAGADVAQLQPRAEANGVTFVPGPDFGAGPDTLRLAFSFVSPEEIAEGVSRLAAAIR